MELNIGQKVAYPNQGVCLVEGIQNKIIGNNSMNFYSLRVLSDNSVIFVPTANAETVGIRPIICLSQYKRLMTDLGKDFEEVSNDWKSRSREYNEKLQTGDVFKAAADDHPVDEVVELHGDAGLFLSTKLAVKHEPLIEHRAVHADAVLAGVLEL